MLFWGAAIAGPGKKTIYKNPEVSVALRVKDLMERMTLEEKIAQMNQLVGPSHMRHAEKELTKEEIKLNDALGVYPGLHSSDVEQMVREGQVGSFLHVIDAQEANALQKMAMESRLQIPLLIGIDAIHGNGLVNGSTIYPTAITMASSFDESLAEEMSIQTAKEMRATGSHWAFTPNIDIARDARWGRVGETFGEDPYLVGNMGVAMIKGLQQGDFTGESKVIACAKHLIGGGEGINGTNHSPFDLSMRTIREVHLPPYRRAVQEAGVYSIMMAHNEMNGIPCHSNRFLMEEVMRKEYGFNGFFVSDWLDIERLHDRHFVAETMDDAYALSINAGMDLHMHGPEFVASLAKSVEAGKVSMERINFAVAKILEAKFKLGLFENAIVNEKKIEARVFTVEHQATALKIARESMVLLKNEGLLPLKNFKGKKLLVTGPNADNQTILGDWAFVQPDDRVITIRAGISELAKEKGAPVEFVDCGDMVTEVTTAQIQAAATAAKSADVAVVVVGENSMRYRWNQKTCGENADRAHINLVGKQLELIQQIKATGTKVIAVLVNGRPIGEPWLAENADALIEAWEPGSFGGQALAEILWGEVNPSGKLPITIPRTVGQGRIFYNQKQSHLFRNFRFESGKPLFAFGYGLSYTQFEISEPILSASKINAGEQLKVSVEVKNTGDQAGAEVVQLYIRDHYSSVTRPRKELKRYHKVFVEAGEKRTITFDLGAEDLAFFDEHMKWGVEKGAFSIMVGNSSRDEDLKTQTFELTNTLAL